MTRFLAVAATVAAVVAAVAFADWWAKTKPVQWEGPWTS